MYQLIVVGCVIVSCYAAWAAVEAWLECSRLQRENRQLRNQLAVSQFRVIDLEDRMKRDLAQGGR